MREEQKIEKQKEERLDETAVRKDESKKKNVTQQQRQNRDD